jgi:ketosteroid isomerase-like protein
MHSRNLMRFVGALSALLLMLSCPARAQPADADVAAVTAAVRGFHAALAAGDAQAAARLLAADAVVMEGGERESRKEYVEHHLLEDIKFAQAVPSRQGKIDVTISGDVAWTHSTSLTQGAYQGKPLNLAGAESMVLSRTPAGWVIRAIHWSSRKAK